MELLSSCKLLKFAEIIILNKKKKQKEEDSKKNVMEYLYIHTYIHIHTFNSLCSRTTWVSWHQTSKPFWMLLKQETMGGSGISWTMCKSFAPHSRHIATPVPHHSIFYGLDALPDTQPTLSKALKAYYGGIYRAFDMWCGCYKWHTYPLDHMRHVGRNVLRRCRCLWSLMSCGSATTRSGHGRRRLVGSSLRRKSRKERCAGANHMSPHCRFTACSSSDDVLNKVCLFHLDSKYLSHYFKSWRNLWNYCYPGW